MNLHMILGSSLGPDVTMAPAGSVTTNIIIDFFHMAGLMLYGIPLIMK